jgi:recombination protein RecA
MLKISGGEPIPEPLIIPTPSFGLNYILGGGLRTGNIHVFWGNTQAGKTTLCLHVLAELQRQDYHAIIVDTEHSITEQWLTHCGIDPEREVWQTNTLEDLLKELLPAIKNKERVALLFDSVNSLESEAFYDNVEASSGMAGGARARRKLFLKILEYMDPVDNIVLSVAQQTNDFSGYMPKKDAKIGEAERHWACNVIKLFTSNARDNIERDKETDRITSKKVKWTVEKSKQGPVEGTTGYYWFDPVTSVVDKSQELVNIAVQNGVIEKKGAWFYFEGPDGTEHKSHGLDGLIKQLDGPLTEHIEGVLMKRDLSFETEEVD